jgi:alpha-mannosidase
LEADNGDTYSADPQPLTEPAQITRSGLQILAQSTDFAKISFQRTVQHGAIRIETEETLFFNSTPVVDWQLKVNSQGANYRLRFIYETGDTESQVYAKMPFDITLRPRIDRDYFGQEVPDNLAPVLLAARELNHVEDFPFQGFAALSNDTQTKSIFAKGLREYGVDQAGNMAVTLKRSVEWLAKSNLGTRVGDAGPYMYVPGAKDERQTRFDLALVDIRENVYSEAFLKWFYLFEYGYIVFENRAHSGTKESARIWDENLPWSGVQNLPGGESLIRVYNPTQNEWQLAKRHLAVDPFGKPTAQISALQAKSIAQFSFDPQIQADPKVSENADINLIEFPAWAVGPENIRIEQSRLDEFAAYAENLRQEQSEFKTVLENLSEDQDALKFHQTKHAVIRIEREIYEAELSLLLNRLKAEGRRPELLDEIRRVGEHLNLVRRQRRTYDYILSLFENM